jgi:thioredoxin 1
MIAEFAGKIKAAKVNVDENQELSTKYNIRGIPSLLLFKAGKVVDTSVGMVTKSQLVDFINKNLNT